MALESDETDDARVGNEYLVTVDVYLIPKCTTEDGNLDVKKFHVKIDFPKQVNGDTMSVCIDQVTLEYLILFCSISLNPIAGSALSTHSTQRCPVFCARLRPFAPVRARLRPFAPVCARLDRGRQERRCLDTATR